MTGKIFCLMGKSSSGKDTVFKTLLQDEQLGLRPVILYTNRPIRRNERQGREYHFVNRRTLISFKNAGKLIEQRDYQTGCGLWSYCTVDDGQIDLTAAHYLLIGTLESCRSLQAYFGAEQVIPLYLDVDDGVRLQRALAREKRQKSPDYNEVCRRFLADNLDFSAEKLVNCGVVRRYDNRNFQACILHLKTDIYQEISGGRPVGRP